MQKRSNFHQGSSKSQELEKSQAEELAKLSQNKRNLEKLKEEKKFLEKVRSNEIDQFM